MITNNKYRVMRKNVVSKEKIKSEDSSLRVEHTSDGLRASISCIESNKLEQETRQGYNLLDTKSNISTADTGVEVKINDDGSINVTGLCNKNYPTFIKSVNITSILEDRQEYTMYNEENSDLIYLQVIIESNDGTKEYLGLPKSKLRTFTIDKTNNKSYYIMIQGGANSKDVEYSISNYKAMLIKGKYTADTIPQYEQFGVMPSIKYKSTVEGITGDVNLKVQNKNLAQNIRYSNPKTQFVASVTANYKLRKDRYYIFSCDTEKTGEKVYLNVGETYGIKYIETWDIMQKVCDGTRKHWIVQAMDSDLHKNRPAVNKSAVSYGTTNGVATGYTYNFMIEEIDVTTKEEALKYVTTEYVEHKEKNFDLSLGNKTLYRGDKIIRKDGKWYFEKNFGVLDNSRNIFSTSKVAQGYYIPSNLLSNFKNGGLIYSTHQKVKYGIKSYEYDNEWVKEDGNFLSQLYTQYKQIYVNYYGENVNDWWINLNATIYYELEESELELIEDENLIKQLDTILTSIVEYDDVTNFDFDNDVVFEINVEKDNIKLQSAELKKEIDNIKALILEQEG